MSETMLAANVAAIVAIRAQIDALKTQLCPLEDAVKIEMAERNAEEITAAGHVVRWKVVTSKRLDTTALKKALPEIVEQYTKEARACRFTVD